MKRQRARGFTLLEVLVALTILALGLAAGIRASGGAAREADALRWRLFADWTAQNCLADLRARHHWPELGQREGYAEQAGIRLHWQEEVSPSPNSRFRRVEIRVDDGQANNSQSSAAPLSRLLAYFPAQ